MAFTQYVEWDVRTTGSDANGGGFDPVSGTPGTDYSQQDAAQIAYTDLVIDGATNTNCTSAGNPFTSAHVGNIINITGGTGFTVQRVQVLSVAAGVATCDKSLGTLSSTGGTGNLGGALLTIGTAGGLHVGGNAIHVKSGTYSSSSTSSNVANGRLTLAAATVPAITRIIGYDAAHNDRTGTRPTMAWGVNAASNYLITIAGGSVIENIVVDGVRGTYTSTRGILFNGGGVIRNALIKRVSSLPVNITTGAGFIDTLELTDNADGIGLTSSALTARCIYAHDNTGSAIVVNSSFASAHIFDSLFDTNGSSPVSVVAGAFTATLSMTNCSFYGNTGSGINITSSSTHVSLANCIFEGNSAYGVGTSGVYPSVRMNNCAFYNNTSGKYSTTNILANQVFGEIIPTVSPFVDAAGGDFRLNMKTGGGASLRGASIPQTIPGLTYAHRRDIGAHQHSGPSRGING